MALILRKVLHFASPRPCFCGRFLILKAIDCYLMDALASFLILQALDPDFVQVFDFANPWDF